MKTKLLVILGFLLLVALSINPLRWSVSEDDNGGLQLEPPPFVALAAEARAQEKGVNFLQQEAGIAAYVKVGQAIDLAQVRGTFKTVETVSDEYIIGEVALRDLPEDVHPHVYVNKEGWIVAYYSKGEPASKIMHWVGYRGGAITTTTLQEAIRQVFSPIRIEEIKYYNFKYPQATRIMLVTEVLEGETDSFHLQIPKGLQLFEASWAHYTPHTGGSSLLMMLISVHVATTM